MTDKKQARVIPVSDIPTWQREAVLVPWARWAVVYDERIDSGHRTREDADKKAQKLNGG